MGSGSASSGSGRVGKGERFFLVYLVLRLSALDPFLLFSRKQKKNMAAMALHARGSAPVFVLGCLVLLLGGVAAEAAASDAVECDIVVAGGSTASLAAAITAAEADRSLSVCLTEITDWPGGQMTAGGWAEEGKEREGRRGRQRLRWTRVRGCLVRAEMPMFRVLFGVKGGGGQEREKRRWEEGKVGGRREERREGEEKKKKREVSERFSTWRLFCGAKAESSRVRRTQCWKWRARTREREKRENGWERT